MPKEEEISETQARRVRDPHFKPGPGGLNDLFSPSNGEHGRMRTLLTLYSA